MEYCETCKHFQHTGVSSDGKPYELGGKCEVMPPTRWQGDYCNGGCNGKILTFGSFFITMGARAIRCISVDSIG